MRRVLGAGFVALVAAAIALGLFLVGGPVAVRKLHEDEARLGALRDLSVRLRCGRPGEAVEPLPRDLTAGTLRDWCGGRILREGDLADPVSGAPFVLERRSDTDFALCAQFHDAERLADRRYGREVFDFDAGSGCLMGRTNPR